MNCAVVPECEQNKTMLCQVLRKEVQNKYYFMQIIFINYYFVNNKSMRPCNDQTLQKLYTMKPAQVNELHLNAHKKQ